VHKHVTNLEKKGLLSGTITAAARLIFCREGKLKQSMAVNTAWCCRWWSGLRRASRLRRWAQRDISLADFVRSKECLCARSARRLHAGRSDSDGDYVLVEKTKTAHNGDIVVALLESSDATLKRFFREERTFVCSLRTRR